MNIYQIDEEIMSCVDEETGEIVDIEKLRSLQMQRGEKIESIGLWIKNLVAESDAIGKEIKVLQARKRASENKAESLKKYLKDALGGVPFKTSKLSISYRKSESVNILNQLYLDDKYLKIGEPTVDKVAIKKDLKAGIAVAGAELVTNQNIQIK